MKNKNSPDIELNQITSNKKCVEEINNVITQNKKILLCLI